MSVPKDENEDFFHPKENREINMKQSYCKYNQRISHSLNIAAVFAVNYVATVKGKHYDFQKTEKMVWDKKLEAYEKKYHPVYLKFILKDNSHLADLVLQRMNSSTDRIIIANDVKIDSKNSTYLYLGAKDALNTDKSRILIFSTINKVILNDICEEMPEFGSSKDMQLHGYYVPDDLETVVRHVQLYCLPKLGNHVSEMREKLASPLKRIFNKKGSISRISLRGSSVKIKRSSNKNEISPNGQSKKSPLNSNLNFKSKSIESLLLVNVNDTNYLSVNLSIDQKSNSHTDVHKSISNHSSINDDQSNDSSNPMISKFEHLLHDERGLKYFKDFLTKEVSSENILFWEAVQKFITIENPELLKTEASKIFYTYIDSTMGISVNLEDDIVKQARSLLDTPRIDMFNAASNHIYYLMKTDSYNRFRKSNYFNLWLSDYKNHRVLKHTSSTSSLNNSKKRMQFLPNLFKGKKDKPKKEDSRKSSQTLDSDGCTTNPYPSCIITMSIDDPNIQCVAIHANKKLNQVLKKIDKGFHEHVATAFDQSDNRIIPFSESMLNLIARKLIVEKSIIIRVGFVQINMDINLLEYVWFVIRPRYSLGLSHAIDPVAKRVGIELGHCVVIKEDDPIPIEWDTQIYTLNKCCLLLVEQSIFRKAKFYGKSTNASLDNLWKKMIHPDSFLSTFPIDNDNIVDSRDDIFVKYKLEPRKVGYIMSGSSQQNDQLETTITKALRYSYDDQRGFVTESQMVVPDFLKELNTQQSIESTSLSSNRFSEIMFGDSDTSFSEMDEFSAPSPSTLDVISDFE